MALPGFVKASGNSHLHLPPLPEPRAVENPRLILTLQKPNYD